MIVVILRVEDSQRQPFKCREPLPLRKILPEKGTPSDVIIAVPIAAADRVRAKLEERKNHHDRDESEYQVDESRRLFGLEILSPRGLRFSGLRRSLRNDFFHCLMRQSTEEKSSMNGA